MASRLALIHNPRSRRNTEDKTNEFRAEAAHALGPLFVQPSSRDAVFDEVGKLARAGVDFIAIDGGDGTVSDVLSAIYRIYPQDSLPALAVLPSGNTNLIAADIGFGARGVEALERLLAVARSDEIRRDIRRRSPLVVQWSDPARPPVLGMFHGTIAFTRAIELAHQPAILDRFSHDVAVVVTLISSLGRLLFKRSRKTWLEGAPIRISSGRHNGEADVSFLFLSTTLKRLSRGIWPFWRDSGAADEGINYLNIKANPPHLLKAIVALMRGRSPQWLRESKHYESGSAARLTLETSMDFVLDGEVFSSGPDGITHLSRGPVFEFIQASAA